MEDATAATEENRAVRDRDGLRRLFHVGHTSGAHAARDGGADAEDLEPRVRDLRDHHGHLLRADVESGQNGPLLSHGE